MKSELDRNLLLSTFASSDANLKEANFIFQTVYKRMRFSEIHHHEIMKCIGEGGYKLQLERAGLMYTDAAEGKKFRSVRLLDLTQSSPKGKIRQRRTLGMRKEIQVKINPKFGTAGLLHGLPHSAVWHCNVLTTFLWIGILTTPPFYRGFELSTFWAWLRYASAISQRHSDLRLKRGWSDIDTHQKTVMSDDFGMGFSCHYLADQHGLQAFANTNYLLDILVGVTSLRPGKRGPAKSPDFIGIDGQGRLHILECKGTQSSTDYLLSALATGVSQKNNFTNVAPFASSMVGGIFVPQHDNSEQALLMYVDPEPDARIIQLGELPRSDVEEAIYRIAFAKELMAGGLWRTASDLGSRGRRRAIATTPPSTSYKELSPAGFYRDKAVWRRSLDYRSIESDPIGSEHWLEVEEYSRRTTLDIEIPDQVIDLTREVLKMDYGGAQKEADKLIADAAKARLRPRRVRSFTRASETAPFTTRIRTLKSSWYERNPTDTSSELTGPSGIRFVITREET